MPCLDSTLTFFRSLQFQFGLGMTAMLALVLLLISLFYLHQKETQSQQQFSNILTSSSTNIDQLYKTAINYTQNAPRNFENYQRDISLTYKAFSKDLSAISSLHLQLKVLLENSTGLWIFDNRVPDIANSYQQLFHESLANYKDSIGNDENEPRLEWAASSLVKDLPVMGEALNEFARAQSVSSQQNLNVLQQAILWSAFLLLLSLVMGSVWFYMHIIRRTRTIKQACEKVAKGDFGVQITHQSKDELGSLSDAFNLMSSQTHMVSKLINDLNSTTSIDQALNVFWQASKPYLGINWAGFLEVNETTKKAKLVADKSGITHVHSELDLTTNAFGAQMLAHVKQSKVLVIKDVNQYRISNGNSRFLRDLHRTTLAKNLYVFPLNHHQKWHGAIMVAHPSGQLTETQLALLEKTSAWMAQHFSRLMSEKRINTKVI
jgi:nitrate/nitrite-specific signal transduction histidine kinase